MRVLLVTGSYPPMRCGVGDYSEQLACRLAALPGVTVGVLSSREADSHRGDRGGEVLPLVDGWSMLSLWQILKAVRRWRPDLVHLQYPTAGYGRTFLPNLLPLLLKLIGLRTVQTWHELPIYSFFLNALTHDTVIAVEPGYAALVPWYFRPFLSRKRLKEIPIASNIPAVTLNDEERRAVRSHYGCTGKRLVVYFGFAHKAKGVDALFRIADPENDNLLLVCDLDPADPYHREILSLMTGRWSGAARATGHLAATEVARMLASADAVVLPFCAGVSARNGSFLAARAQRSFIVTTHCKARGFHPGQNVFYAAPGDDAGMRSALHASFPTNGACETDAWSWDAVAEAHLKIYRELTKR